MAKVAHAAGLAGLAWAWTGAFVVVYATNGGFLLLLAQWAALIALFFAVFLIERSLNATRLRHRQ